MNSLSGKTALVTGASRGIGRGTALALAEAGAEVLVHYSRAEKEADTVVAAIRDKGGRADFTKTETGREITLGLQALKRIAQPDDVGDVIAFLASDAARWVTGDTVRVDGGSKL